MDTLFIKNSSANIRLVIFALLSVVMMVLDYRYDYLSVVRSSVSLVVSPLQFAVDFPISMSHRIMDNLVIRDRLLQENQHLKEQQLLLNWRLQRFQILEQENKRLRQLLSSSVKLGERALVAELLAVDLQPLRQQVVIDKGTTEGIYKGQPVMDAYGIMGQVDYVGPLSSTVLLITDQSHSLPVEIVRNGLKAIAFGSGHADRLLLGHLSNNADIQMGDLIASSGLGKRFPAGYPVGTVIEIQADPSEPFAKIQVLPSARLGASNKVLLVWPSK